MLQELARGNPLSPTQFGLSTHNAIAAQYTIARGLPANYLVVSAGACSAEAAMVEAQGLLADGASDVLVVNYDSPVPDDYREFDDEPGCDFAWALRVGRADAQSGPGAFSLGAVESLDAPALPSILPHGLDVLRFILSEDRQLAYAHADGAWLWQRHA